MDTGIAVTRDTMMKTPYGWNLCVRSESSPWQSQQALELLQPDRWMNWHFESALNAPGFVPTIWSGESMAPGYRERIINRLRTEPAETWLFLNEPHLSDQAHMTPAEGVDAVFELLNLAHSIGADINWCGPNCAINQEAEYDNPLSGQEWWREWLRLLRRKGIGEPSIHGIHLYRGDDRATVKSVWDALRHEWRWQWIGRNRPVVVTEHCAYDKPFRKQKEVMDECFRLYEIGRKQGPAGEDGVMGVFWFVATGRQGGSGDWPNCALTEVDPGKTQTMRLTPLGKHWLALQARLR